MTSGRIAQTEGKSKDSREESDKGDDNKQLQKRKLAIPHFHNNASVRLEFSGITPALTEATENVEAD